MTSQNIEGKVGETFSKQVVNYLLNRTHTSQQPPYDERINRGVRVDALSTTVVCAPTSNILKDILAERWHLNKDDNYVFVLPPTLLISGKSFAALEFLVYFNAYIKNNVANGKPLQVVCTENQAINMSKFLERTIMGPNWDDPSVYPFVEGEEREFLNNTKKMYAPRLADGTMRPLSDFIQFSVFDANGKARVEIPDQGTLLVEQARAEVGGVVSGYGVAHEKFDETLNQVITASNSSLIAKYNVPEMPLIPIPDEAIKKVQDARYGFAVTCLGNSTGFDKDSYTTSFVVWCKGPGILIDPSPEALKAIEQMGFVDRDIPHVLLTHCHEDHDAGIIERILQGKKVNLLCSKVVYEELIVKIQAILQCQDIESSIDPHELVDWVELKVNQKTKVDLGNGKSVLIKTWWNVHTIPTNGVAIYCDDNSVYHSSDTQFGIDFLNEKVKSGIMTAERRQQFIDELVDENGKPRHNLTYFEMGGPPIHTSFEEINKIIAATHHHKVFGYHAPQGLLVGSDIKRAELYDTQIITKPNKASIQRFDRSILIDSGFGLNEENVDAIMKHPTTSIKTIKAGTLLMNPDDPVRKNMYMILSGTAEIYEDSVLIGKSGAGAALGDWGYLTGLPPTATVIASTDMRVIECEPKKVLDPEVLITLRDMAHFDRNYALLFSRFFRSLGVTLNDLPLLTSSIKDSHRLLQIPAHGQIVMQGEPAHDLFFIVDGGVNITFNNGNEDRLLRTRSAGDFFGEKALNPGTRRTASVTAGSNGVTLIAINGQRFKQVLNSMPGLLNAFDLYLQTKIRPV